MKYHNKLALLVGLMVGFLALQRVLIAIIMPAIVADMKLTYTDVGLIISVTGLCWGAASFFWSALGDHYGRKPVIILCTILAAVFSWITGLVHSLGFMLTVRGLLGLVEGGPNPPAVATLMEVSPPEKRATYAGFITGMFMLVGMFFGPFAAVWALAKFGSWRPVFYVISIPALIIGITMAFVMKESPVVAENIRRRKEGISVDDGKPKVKLIDVLKYRNVLVSTVNSIPCMAFLFVYIGFSSLFLTKIHHFNMGGIGLIMSASGLGAFLFELGTGALSDFIGRKPALILAAALTAIIGIVIALTPVGTSVTTFAVLYFFWAGAGLGVFPLYLYSVPSESVPAEIAGTAVGVPQGVGEILGSAVMPAIAGVVADKFGLYGPIWMAALAGVVIVVISLFYIETAPRRVAKMKVKPTADDHLLSRFRQPRPGATTLR